MGGGVGGKGKCGEGWVVKGWVVKGWVVREPSHVVVGDEDRVNAPY